MKSIKIISTTLIFTLMFMSCQKVLDAPPRDAVSEDNFFTGPDDLKLAVNDLYSILPGASVYEDDSKSDNIVPTSLADRVDGTRRTPTSKGSGGWSWGALRRINWVIQNAHKVKDEAGRKKYLGIAKFFRAYFYFKKVQQFGDVPWYSKVLRPDDSALYKPRDPRTLVMDSIMADLNFAIENIPAEKKLYRITKYTALVLKAEVGLFEGTFRKYHNLGPYKEILEAGASAAKELINSGAYSLYKEGGPDKAYFNLFELTDQDKTETILANGMLEGVKETHVSYHMTAPTSGQFGFTQDLVNSYLMADGTRFTDQPGYKTMGFYEEMQNRDPRLTQTTAGPDFVVPGETSREPVNLTITSTGYRVIKALQPRDSWCFTCSHNDIIIFRYGEALLIYAEAKAELGTLTQEDLDISINKLRDRVGMPHLNMAYANANPDPYLENEYPNVDKGSNEGVILEIRRERRIELANEGRRWNDLMRWKEGKKIEQPMVGIYFSGLGSYDFNNDGVPDVYLSKGDASGAPDEVTSIINIEDRKLRDPITGTIGGTSGNLIPFPDGGHFDESKDYFYPIPIEDLVLNENLEQNPGWDKP